VVVVDSLATGKGERLNNTASLVVGDIRDGSMLDETFREARPDVCFHLAAQADVRRSVEEPVFDGDVNVLGTVGVLEASRAQGAQVVFSSTGGAIYGECERPAGEDSALQPISPYGTSKLAAEEYLRTYNRLYGTQHVALRYANVYGPRQDPHGEAGVVAIFFGRIASGEQPRIYGDGRQTRDYVYVDDVVEASLRATEKAGGVFNVGTGQETSVVELYDVCRRVSGADLEPEFAEMRLGELARSVLDPARAVSELGFHAEVSLEEGLGRTWDSIQREGEERAGAK
jgi:UDP-glucose 4-epimerase